MTRTGPKRVRIQEPEAEPETPTYPPHPPPPPPPPHSTPSSPTKATKDAIKLAVASLPTSLQPLILHFGNKIITARLTGFYPKFKNPSGLVLM